MKYFYLTSLAICISICSFAQPAGFNYQAVLRDEGGNILANSPATLRFSFFNFNTGAPMVYQEVHDLETSELGLITTIVGPEAGIGFLQVGNWNNILWGEYEVFMKVEVDLLDGNGYISLGIQQMWSVPQAIVSGKAVNMVMSDMLDVHYPASPQEGQVLMYSADEWENWVPTSLPPISDDQTVSVFLEEISIEGGNSVNLNSWCRDGNTGIGANAYLGTEDGHDLVFKTNAAERMRLGQDGGLHVLEGVQIDQNVGIGIAPSTFKLHLHSETNPQPAIKWTNASTGSNLLDGCYIGLTTTNHMNFVNNEASDMIFTNNIFERMRIKSNGNIGIGTTNPLNMLSLHTDSGIDTYMRFSSAPAGLTTNDGVLLGLASNLDFNIMNKESTPIKLFTNNQVRMTVSATGNVGIGTTSPSALLDVDGLMVSNTLNVFGLAQVGDLETNIVMAGDVSIQSMDDSGLDPNCNFGLRTVRADCNGNLVLGEEWDDGNNTNGYYVTVPGCAFRPEHPGVDYTIDALGALEIKEGDYNGFFAPVSLPNKAYILEIKVYIQDYFDDGNVTVCLLKNNLEGAHMTAQATSSGSSGNQVLTFVPPYANQVDNTHDMVMLKAWIAQAADPGSGQVFVKGATIRYKLY